MKAVFMAGVIAACAASPSLAQDKREAEQSISVAGTREELAERYFSITNRYAFVFDAYEKQLKSAMTFCDQKPCKSDLDRSIAETLNEVGPTYRQRMVRIYADHLTEGQLLAVIRFAETPEGRAITEAQGRMTDEIAMAGNEIWKDVNVGVSRRFCSVQQQICVRSPPAPASTSNAAEPK